MGPPAPAEPRVIHSNPLFSLWIDTMNRCPKAPFLRSGATLLTVGALALAHVASMAQSLTYADPAAEPAVRPFPVAAVRATMVVTQPPEVLIDGQPARMSPGARIRGANNMLVLSGSIVGKTYLVNLVRDPLGQVHDVWILTPSEARLERPTAAPRPY